MKDLREHQLYAIEALEYLTQILDRNNIKYFLLAGSCLGAVRHKGFIPWDDDIDIGIFNEDYDRFETVLIQELPKQFTWFNAKTDNLYPRFFGKILNGTTPSVDVFRLVKMPQNKYKQKQKWILKNILVKLYSRKCHWKFESENTVVYYFSYILSLLFSKAALLKICRWNENRFASEHNYDYVNMYSYYGLKRELISYKLTLSISKVEFEGKKYTTFSDTDTYLTNLYGDYMTPPSPDKRKPEHIANKFV